MMIDEKKDAPDWDELSVSKLKKLNSEEIENIISSALGKALGCEFQAELKIINFQPFDSIQMNNATELKLIISDKSEKTPF